MQRNTYIGIAVILVIFIGIVLYAATRPVPAKAPGATVALPGNHYVEHAPYYDIAANYATSTPLAAAENTVAVAEMKRFVADTIAQFKSDGNFATLTPQDAAKIGLGAGRKETLNIVYLTASSSHTVSYIFTVYEDTLGAHGNTFFKTFTFDTTSGAALTLADLFAPGADYLGTLSSLARAKLPAITGQGADAAFITPDTTPDDKNFANFFFDNQNLVILFPPYAVAPYAAGPQTLRIPTSELANILKPEYR
ncbi:MAG: hypothetical protein B7W98_01795 [Parcubacteria group bacterium 20-58-5]|nr:MAG: hypothetical protein B7W98_01795 [Parcubacteria group bacterium 20-58-5]